MGGPEAWRLIEGEPASGPANMAIDEALMESVRAGGFPVLRFYRWAGPWLSLGRNQPAVDVYDADRLAGAGIGVVRRRTGGRAVLHHAELTYAVVCSDRELGSARAAYRAINEALVEGLSRLGAAAAVVGPTGRRAPVPSSAPCFAEPVEGEVLARGRKLVGSAQLRVGGILLQHGSLPFRPSESGAAVAAATAGASDGVPAYLETVLGFLPEWDEIVAALRSGWASRIAPLDDGALSGEECARTAALAASYADPQWTWRR